MKIAFINQPQDPIEAGDEQRGSVSIVNWELAKRLSERHEVVIYAPRAPGQAAIGRWGRIKIRRIRFVATRLHKILQLLKGRFSTQPYFASSWYFREYFWQIGRDLRVHPVDIVHLPQQLQFAQRLRRAVPGAKVVVHMHQDELAQLEAVRLGRQLTRLDAVVTVSDYVTNRARARFPRFADCIHTIGNGVDVERYRPDPARFAADLPPQRILFVGRISPDKGVHLLMQAFDRLVGEGRDLRLTLVGKPGMLPFGLLKLLLREDPGAVEHLRRFYGRSLSEWLSKEVLGQRHSYPNDMLAGLPPQVLQRIHFLGTITLSELLRQYAQADLLVLPSVWHESYGLPVAEAMASAVPVIAARCGGVPELLEEGVTGLLVARMDVDALVGAMRALLTDTHKAQAMGRAGRMRAEKMLTWTRSAERLERVYRDLCSATVGRAQPASSRTAWITTSDRSR